MSNLKKGIVKILRCLFVLLLVSFLFKFAFDGFMQKGMTKIIANNEIVTNLFSEFGLKSHHIEKILNDEIVNQFFGEVAKDFLYDFSNGEVIKNKDLAVKIKTFVMDNRKHIEDLVGFKLYDAFINSLDKQPALLELDIKYAEVISYSHDNIPDYGRTIIKVLISVSSISYSIIFNLVILFLVAIIIVILQWKDFEFLSSIGVNVIGCGIFMFIITCLINFFMRSILLYLPVQLDFDFMRLFYTSIITLAVGIVLKLIYVVITKLIEKKEMKSLEIS